MWYIFYFLTVFTLVAGKNEEYKGYRLYKLTLESELQQRSLLSLNTDAVHYIRKPNFMSSFKGLAMIAPDDFIWFEKKLTELDITVDVFSRDVYQYLNESEDSETDSDPGAPFDIRRYNRYADILAYLQELAARYSTTTTRIELREYGVTHENRTLVYLKIHNTNTAGGEVRDKPVIVVEAGIIPKEWITIPAALNVVEKLLEVQRFSEGADWIVLPVVNPDGYEYTHTNLRFWTKSKSTKSIWGAVCPGVNINRNFDMDWQNFDASSSPCNHVYAGIEPFSEIETQMLKTIISEYGTRIKLYLSLQNNGGFVSYPWSYERAASGMFLQHITMARNMVTSLTDKYNVGVSSTIFDRASGTSSDYARIHGIEYTYNIDIVHRGETVVIPVSEIGVIVDDVWKIIGVAADEIIRLYSATPN